MVVTDAEETSAVVRELEFPAAFVKADISSVEAQTQFTLYTRLQLILLIVAGAVGLFTVRTDGFDVAALVGGVAFVTAAFLRFLLLRRRLHKAWYEGRAGAESIKTLSYRYAFGGDPFRLAETSADARFEEHVTDVLHGLSSVEAAEGRQPTDSMRAVRAAPLIERRAAYRELRIEDQVEWYTRKAAWNRRRARFWGLSILVFQLAGAAGLFLKGFGLVDFDVFGLAAAVVGSAAAWFETRQHASLASAYAVTADELRRIASLVDAQDAEEKWARFVAEAEGAISREHTMWKASASQLRPASLA